MKRILALLTLALVAGCSQIADHYEKLAAEQQMTIIIQAGMKVRSGDREFVIWGDDECPNNNGAMGKVFGYVPDFGDRGCIAVPWNAQVVTVHLVSQTGSVLTERWSVRHYGKHGQRAGFVRPDGTLIFAADPPIRKS